LPLDLGPANGRNRRIEAVAHSALLKNDKRAIFTAAPHSQRGVVAARNPGSVAKLYHDDPFWPTGLRKSVRVPRMKPRFCRRQADR
jgi:hypothetical protein